MKFSPYIIDLLKQKSNKDFRLSGDCEYLALDIESVMGEHIGVNTVNQGDRSLIFFLEKLA
jgi:hypothetical protein